MLIPYLSTGIPAFIAILTIVLTSVIRGEEFYLSTQGYDNIITAEYGRFKYQYQSDLPYQIIIVRNKI